ncbi:MAG: hypothetical protein R3C56_12910 [Pirellulaceae bacterium]
MSRGRGEVQVLPHDVSYQLSTDANEANLNGLVYDRPLAGSHCCDHCTADRSFYGSSNKAIYLT